MGSLSDGDGDFCPTYLSGCYVCVVFLSALMDLTHLHRLPFPARHLSRLGTCEMYLVNPPHYNESTPFYPSPSVKRAWICRLRNYRLQPIVIHQPHNSHCYRIQYVSRFSFEFVSLKVGDIVVTLGLLLWKTLLGAILFNELEFIPILCGKKGANSRSSAVIVMYRDGA